MTFAVAIRDETPADAGAVRALVSAAFGDGAETSDFVEAVRREAEVCLAEVATQDGVIIGHAQWCAAPMEVEGRPLRSAYLACLSAAPGLQRRGVGSQLVRHGLERLRAAGFAAASLLGDPAYYVRFGFSSDLARRIDAPHRARGHGFQALELSSGVFGSGQVRVDYPTVVAP